MLSKERKNETLGTTPLGLGRLCYKFHPLFYSYILIYSTIMLSKLTHYAFKCTTILNYAYQIIFLLLYITLSMPGSPDSPLSNSVSLALAPLSIGRLGPGCSAMASWTVVTLLNNLVWELIIHCACALRWPNNRPLLCSSSRNKCPLC